MVDSNRNPALDAADALAIAVLRLTEGMKPLARHSVGSQLCRAAVSVACNLVESRSRRSARERLRFVEIADGSLREAGYLVGLAGRAGLIEEQAARELGVLHALATARVRSKRAGAARTALKSPRGTKRRRVTKLRASALREARVAATLPSAVPAAAHAAAREPPKLGVVGNGAGRECANH